ncbi:MAG TPA: hypothetical protein DD670_21525, partial [Planctomycetaceae bacterium]|nr:hypothetical protein [Planctomycetaceae bacterium]
AIDLHSRLLLKQCGLTSPQLTALIGIQRLQPVTVGKLAREIHLGQATVTGILARLEARALVVRTRGSRDRRSILVELTESGADLLGRTPSPLQERFRRELSRLHEWERTTILATLQRIAAMMDAERIEAAPVLASGIECVDQEEENLSRYLEEVMPSHASPLVEGLSSNASEQDLLRGDKPMNVEPASEGDF